MLVDKIELNGEVISASGNSDDEWKNGDRPIRMRFISNIDDFFPLPFSIIIFPPMNDIRAERCAAKSVRTVRITGLKKMEKLVKERMAHLFQ